MEELVSLTSRKFLSLGPTINDYNFCCCNYCVFFLPVGEARLVRKSYFIVSLQICVLVFQVFILTGSPVSEH